MSAVPITPLSDTEIIERLRVHGRILMGYAMGLARRSGLTPNDAQRLFLDPLIPGESAELAGSSSLSELEQWVREEAQALGVVHGHVTVEREGETWAMTIPIEEDVTWLATWDVPVTYWTEWLSRHVERVAIRHGAVAETATDDKLFVIRLASSRAHRV